jgi:hypothetical protein
MQDQQKGSHNTTNGVPPGDLVHLDGHFDVDRFLNQWAASGLGFSLQNGRGVRPHQEAKAPRIHGTPLTLPFHMKDVVLSPLFERLLQLR